MPCIVKNSHGGIIKTAELVSECIDLGVNALQLHDWIQDILDKPETKTDKDVAEMKVLLHGMSDELDEATTKWWNYYFYVKRE